MTSSIRPTHKQHTVTKRVLKEFMGRQGKLAVFDVARGKRQLRAPGAGIFTTDFDTFDSRGAEARWNIFETHFPAALTRVRSRKALDDPKTVDTLKDMLALHWARSAAMRVARERVIAEVVAEHKRSMVKTRPDLLERAFTQDTGLVAASHAELEWLSEKVHDRVVAQNSAMWNSHRDPVNFAAARTHFDQFSVQVGYANGRDLLISDCPVISTIQGLAGTGPHHGIGIRSADHIAMPIAPDLIVGLGPDPAIHELSDEAVDQYNHWQWEACVSWIAARPDAVGDTWLKVGEQLAAQK